MVRPDRRYVSLAVKSAVKELLWYATCSHEQGDRPNILLFATRRGGSTLAMEMIGANRGIRTLDQPLELVGEFPTAAQSADVPMFRQGQMTSLDPWTEARLEHAVQRMLDGRAVANAPTRVWRRDVERRSNRLVLKITDAKPIIEWFDERFDCRIVYLTRHPIPQALSCIRNRWSLTVDAHLRDAEFVAANLADRSVAEAHDVMRNGTELQRFVLNWALENVAPARALHRHPDWLHVRYEDCVRTPDAVLATLADELELDDLDRMRAALGRPSVSSRISTVEARTRIESGRANELLHAWRNDVDDATEAWCTRLLELFEIDPELVLP